MSVKRIPFHRTNATAIIPFREEITLHDADGDHEYLTHTVIVELERDTGTRWHVVEIHASAHAKSTTGRAAGAYREALYDIRGFKLTPAIIKLAKDAADAVGRDSMRM